MQKNNYQKPILTAGSKRSGTNLVERVLKGFGFIKFTLTNVKPLNVSLKIIVYKFLQKIFNKQLNNINFQLVIEGIKADITVNDMEQYTYLFNIFYNELFRVSCKVRENPTIIDGGANIGATSLYFASKYHGVKLFAFDPSKSNVSLYKKNLSSIENTKIEQKALWDKSETLKFNFSEISRYHSAFDGSEKYYTEDVDAVKLSEWIEENKLDKIDVLKLNIEGAELKAIKGLGNKIAEIKVIIGELHPQYVNPEELVNELTKNNFKIVRMERTGKIVSIFEAHNRKYLIES